VNCAREVMCFCLWEKSRPECGVAASRTVAVAPEIAMRRFRVGASASGSPREKRIETATRKKARNMPGDRGQLNQPGIRGRG